ncbi:hypothetical protein QUB08_30400 [Microcoleus sp. BR0-C5]
MPVPQENLSFVEQASCLLLTMVQDVSLTAEGAEDAERRKEEREDLKILL